MDTKNKTVTNRWHKTHRQYWCEKCENYFHVSRFYNPPDNEECPFCGQLCENRE